jgi:hypothetical protein
MLEINSQIFLKLPFLFHGSGRMPDLRIAEFCETRDCQCVRIYASSLSGFKFVTLTRTKNLPANQHPPSIPGLEFTGGDILPFH